jgi:hypothetical protein
MPLDPTLAPHFVDPLTHCAHPGGGEMISCIYSERFEAQGAVDTKKMVLMK